MDCRCDWSTFMRVIVVLEVVVNGFPSVVEFSVPCYTSSVVGEGGVRFEL